MASARGWPSAVSSEPRHDRDRAGEVAGEVHGVGSERGAALAAGGARGGGGPGGVDHEDDREQGYGIPGRLHLSPAAAEAHDRGDRDPGRGQYQDRRLAECREVLRLAVAVRVLRIRGAFGHADGPEREQSGPRVHARVDRLGEDAEAARREADDQFDGDQRERRAQREERGAPCHRHAPDRTRTMPPPCSRVTPSAVHAARTS